MLVLDEAAVRRHLTYEKLIPAIAQALVDLSAGRVVQPVRTVVPVEPHGGFMGSMPAYAGALGAKLVTFFPNNEGVPTHHALILLFRPETGEPIAVLDGRLITEMRTAAASAVATQLLARPDASSLALLGSGVQASSHLEALRTIRPLQDIRVWSPRHAAAFAERHGVIACGTAEEAVRGADIIVVATSARSPVLQGAWLAPGTHVNAVGATRPEWRELYDDLLRQATVYVDSLPAARVESGDIIAAGQSVEELGVALARGNSAPWDRSRITVFKSVGVAVEDLVAASLVYEAARRAGEVS